MSGRTFSSRWSFTAISSTARFEAVRFATGSRANIKFSDQREDLQIDFKFEHEGGPAAFGFSLWVDAVKFQCRLPNFDLASISNNRELMAGLRTARFLYEISHDEAISVNPFLGGWLAETVLAGIGSEAVLKKCTPEQAFYALQHNSAGIALIDVPACIFQTLYDAQTGAEVEQDLQQSLRELLSQAPVMAKIEDWVELLWQPLDNSWLEWLTLNFINTLGAALLQTAMQLCPDADDNDLILDLNGGPVRSALLAPDQHEIWLSETTVGGGGILERSNRFTVKIRAVSSSCWTSTSAPATTKQWTITFGTCCKPWEARALRFPCVSAPCAAPAPTPVRYRRNAAC